MASTIKVNNIQNQCGANIVNKCSTTITLGASGDNITLACGATQSGFGRTGTVNWDTTAKTTNFTAVSGNGYFCNTTSAGFTATLPASPSAGDIVSFMDYAGTWATNNLTIDNNSSKIGGVVSSVTLDTLGQSVTFVYVDATQGWLNTQDSTSNERGNPFVAATGGTITTCGNYKLHTFTAPGTFTVTNAGSPSGSTSVSSVIVAGGGGGGSDNGAGAGAGGFLGATTIPVSVTAYPITVGAGGAGGTPGGCAGSNGSNSVFSVFTSVGGGGGAQPGQTSAKPGGSGGGASRAGGSSGGCSTQADAPGFACSAFGNIGGAASPETSGGGGGAGAAGQNAPSPTVGGNGGAGKNAQSSFHPNIPAPSFPNCGVYAGGGGAGKSPGSAAPGGGGAGATGPAGDGGAGTANTGGGGGGGAGTPPRNGGQGGSGVVVISYRYQ